MERQVVLAFAAGALAAGAVLLPLGRAGEELPPAHGRAATSPRAPADTFEALMHQAMVRMDAGMEITPSGDPDVDFARMMIPHHQGAVDMALAELRFGRDERLRRLAQGIVVEQRQEIDVMRAALRDLPAAREGSR
jgi:uncharacterized protein (DUF305 family)